MKLKQIVDITKILSDRKIPDDVIKFLDDDHTHLLEEFKMFNESFDKLREENFKDVYPELAEL